MSDTLKSEENLNSENKKESVFKHFETGTPIKEYVFLKNVDESKATVFDVYRTKLNIVNNDTTFILTHRQTFTK